MYIQLGLIFFLYPFRTGVYNISISLWRWMVQLLMWLDQAQCKTGCTWAQDTAFIADHNEWYFFDTSDIWLYHMYIARSYNLNLLVGICSQLQIIWCNLGTIWILEQILVDAYWHNIYICPCVNSGSQELGFVLVWPDFIFQIGKQMLWCWVLVISLYSLYLHLQAEWFIFTGWTITWISVHGIILCR